MPKYRSGTPSETRGHQLTRRMNSFAGGRNETNIPNANFPATVERAPHFERSSFRED